MNYFKQFFGLILIVAVWFMLDECRTTFNTVPTYVDDIFLGAVLLFIIAYQIWLKINVMSLRRLKKLSPDEILEFDTVYDNLTQEINEVYVRPITWLRPKTWRILDYKYIADKYKLNLAKTAMLENKLNKVSDLIKFMEAKKTKKKYKIDYIEEYGSTILTISLCVLFFAIYMAIKYN